MKHTTAPARTIKMHLFVDPFRQHALHQSPQEVEARVGVDEVDAVDAERVVRSMCEKLLRAQAGEKTRTQREYTTRRPAQAFPARTNLDDRERQAAGEGEALEVNDHDEGAVGAAGTVRAHAVRTL